LLHLKYILIGVFADMVAVQDMEPPDLFHGDGREDTDGEIDDCLAVKGDGGSETTYLQFQKSFDIYFIFQKAVKSCKDPVRLYVERIDCVGFLTILPRIFI
jgi:hypothetical protein